MSDNKKLIEKECLTKTQEYIPRASKQIKTIMNLLNGEIVESESPDFLIKNEGGVIGVEHFLIDTLLERKNNSRSRSRQSEMKRTFKRFNKNIDGNEEKALSEVQSIIQADMDCVQNFDYNNFIKEFKRIVMEHTAKARNYKQIHKELTKIMFLIEINISKNKMIGYVNNEMIDIKGRCLPFTNEMLNVLKIALDKVDYIVISVMHENYKKCPYVVYAFERNKFDELIKAQLKKVYLQFTYDWQTNPFKTKLKLNLESKK